MSAIGVVAIGRNEGERLMNCLRSVVGNGGAVVYVDSGSSDGSEEAARSMGVEVVELGLSLPFSAARARNAGFERLMQIRPEVEYVQFVDGDCEVAAGWMERAVKELDGDSGLAVVCGRRRERSPEASVYNRLCDMEWDTPVGEAKACGGDAMMRVKAFAVVGGFDAAVVAGEEPELCQRLRRAGWRIRRVDAEMTLHDAAMTRLGQWWRRSMRGGHAYAEGAHMHGRGPDRHWVRQTRSNWFWGLLLPMSVAATAWVTRGLTLVLLLGYLVLFWRICRWMHQRGRSASEARLYALFCVLCKFPEVVGQIRYYLRRIGGKGPRLIEYKSPRPLSVESASSVRIAPKT